MNHWLAKGETKTKKNAQQTFTGCFMKTRNLGPLAKTLAVTITAGLAVLAQNSMAQELTATNATSRLPYSLTQILQLEQAKVSDDTIIGFIKNSHNIYVLDAEQIIYLRQQGVSDAVLTAMLTQPKPSVPPSVASPNPTASATPASPPPAPAPPQSTTVIAAPAVPPAVTYVQPAPATYYYYPAYAYPPYRYYGWPHP